MFSSTVALYGTEQPLPEQIPLRAGPLSLIYENGDLRYVKLGEHEILRRVYVAVRDHNWDTIPAELTDVTMDIRSEAFAITYHARHQQNDVDFAWTASIEGRADGTLVFEMNGEVLHTFLRNRIGFCVLHPMNCAGARTVIEHTDGSTEENIFPVQIAPQLAIDGTIRPVYPFADMRSLSHEVEPGVTAKVAFSGDIFEMEDQRNWTDASYKTYSTPLELPFPVEVAAGTKIWQSAVLTLEGNGIKDQKLEDRVGEDVVSIRIDHEAGKSMPAIGVGMASHNHSLNDLEIERLRTLNLSHLRVDLHLHNPTCAAWLSEATAQADSLGVALEAAIFVSENAENELADLRRQLDELSPPVCRWLVFQDGESVTPDGLVELARTHLASYAPDACFGGGSNAYFTDINRQRPDTSNLDFVTYSLNPQVHAYDNASLAETVEAQAVTVESVRSFAHGRGIVISPVTLRPRFNPNATGPEPASGSGELPSQVDERQMSLFGAAWTVSSLKHLLSSGLEAVTYFETTGWRGLMEQAAGSPLPERFHSAPDMVFPLYHVLADVGEFPGIEIGEVATSDSLRVDGFALRCDDDLTLLLANLSPQPQQVAVDGMGSLARLRLLDEAMFDMATAEPDSFREHTNTLSSSDGVFSLTLPPYAVARIDTNIKLQALLDECVPLIKLMGKGRKAISLGGSYGKGTSDRRSDVDFRLFCDATSASNVYESDAWQSFHEAVTRWRADGIDIDYCWVRTVDQIETQLNAWLGGQIVPGDPVWCLWGYHLLTDLANQVVLDDPDGLIAAWQARLTPYPPTLKQAIIDNHMKSLTYWRADYHYKNKVTRGDVVFLAGVASRLVHDVMQILFALNGIYYVGDGKNLHYAAGFSILPDDFVQRVEHILYPTPSEDVFDEQYNGLMVLIDDVIVLLDETRNT